jgi:hypothetical protein
MMAKTKNDTAPVSPELMKALNFTDADLKANREGYLTQRQRRKILLTEGCLVVFLWFFVAVLSLYYFNGEPFHWWQGNLALFGCTSIYGLVFLGFIAAALALQEAVRKDLKNAPAVLRERISKPHQFTRKHFSICAGKQEFHVSRQVYEAFHEGGKYELFYAPRTETLLAAVPLKPDAPYRMN